MFTAADVQQPDACLNDQLPMMEGNTVLAGLSKDSARIPGAMCSEQYKGRAGTSASQELQHDFKDVELKIWRQYS